MEVVTINKGNSHLFGEIKLPYSKSISNRALILNFISGNLITIINPSTADDSTLMEELLNKISTEKSHSGIIEINCKNAGTVFRFLSALLATTKGEWILTGSERMKERPIGVLVNALQQLGAQIGYTEKTGYPPLQITGSKLKTGKIEIDANVSSQFISAILLISPILGNDLRVDLLNNPGSLPYLEMTIKMLKMAGIDASLNNQQILVRKDNLKPTIIKNEPDWSSASYWYEMVALSQNADITLLNLKKESLQGDRILPEIYTQLGVHTSFESRGVRLTKKQNLVSEFNFDFRNYPDIAQSVIATCAGLNIPGKFSGLSSLAIKETDRLKAMQSELNQLGYNTRIIDIHTFELIPEKNIEVHQKSILKTWGDHRMAMALAPLTLKHGTLNIEDPAVTSKSYPDFWKHVEEFGFSLKNVMITL